MPTRTELIAHNRNAADVSRQITADKVIYQDLDELEASVRAISGGHLTQFDASCFNGKYVTGDIDAAYLDALESGRAVAKAQETLVVSDDEQ
jgi:amidophosphoribosyltransferase